MKSRRDRMRMRLCGCIMYLVHFKSDYLRQQQPCAALAFVVLPCHSSNEVVGGSPHGRLVADDSQVPHARYVCVCQFSSLCCHHRDIVVNAAPINRLLLFTIFASTLANIFKSHGDTSLDTWHFPAFFPTHRQAYITHFSPIRLGKCVGNVSAFDGKLNDKLRFAG